FFVNPRSVPRRTIPSDLGSRENDCQLRKGGWHDVLSTIVRSQACPIWRLALTGLLLLSVPVLAQSTVGTGSIVGSVTDPSGAVVSGAKVTVTNVATGQVVSTGTNSSGAYNSGALVPGSYKVQVSAKGFSSVNLPVTVLLGNTSTANARLQIGQESQVVEVQASEVQ